MIGVVATVIGIDAVRTTCVAAGNVCMTTGAGSSAQTAATGTSSHKAYVAVAPMRLRNGLRSNRTTAIARLDAIVAASSACHTV